MEEFKNIITIEPGKANLKSEIESPNGVYVKTCRKFVADLVAAGFKVSDWTIDQNGKSKSWLSLVGAEKAAATRV